MALDAEFERQFSPRNNEWFEEYSIAWKILKEGRQTISSQKKELHNLQCLLSNFCEIGKKYWVYAPGSAKNRAELRALRCRQGDFDRGVGNRVIQDCQTLADGFVMLAHQIGYKDVLAHHIQKMYYEDKTGRVNVVDYDLNEWYRLKEQDFKVDKIRLITKPGIVTFDGKSGAPGINYAWGFGDHWITVSTETGVCFDPTFKFSSFKLEDVEKVYLGWYAKQVNDPRCYSRIYYKDIKGVQKNIFIKPNDHEHIYTFKAHDSRGRLSRRLENL